MSKRLAVNSTKHVKNYAIILIFIILLINEFDAKIDFEHKLCGDNNCNAPIGFGKTTVMYSKSDDHLISFPAHAKVIIFGKSEDDKLFDVEINGKRGFAPKHLILEEKMVIKNPQISVKVHKKEENSSINSEINSSIINVQNNSNVNTHDISDNKKLNDEIKDSISNEELQTSHSESESESVNALKDGFTVIDGTLLPDDEYISIVLPTIMSESATATKTATISANLNYAVDSDLNEEHLKSSLIEEKVHQNDDENLINDRIDEKNNSDNVNEDLQNSIKPSLPTAVVEPTVQMIASDNSESGNFDNTETHSQDTRDFKEQQETLLKQDSDIINGNIDNNNQLADDSIAKNPINETSSVNSTPSHELPLNDADLDNTEKVEMEIIESKTNESDTSFLNNSLNENVSVETLSQSNDNVLHSNIPNNEILDNSVIVGEISEKNSEIDETVSKEINPESISNEDYVDNSYTNDLPLNIQIDNLDNIEKVESELNEHKSENPDVSTNESLPESVNSDRSSLDNEQKNDINFDGNNNLNKTKILDNKTIEDKMVLPNNSLSESAISNISLDNITSTNAMPLDVQNKESLDNLAVKMEVFEHNSSSGDIHDSFSLMFFLQQYINIIKIYTEVINDILPDDIKIILRQFNISSHLVVFTSIIAFNWCMMKLIIAIRFSTKKETDLREIGCKAQRQAYYFEAEKVKLHAEVDKEREKAQLSEDSLQKLEHKIFPMEMEIKKLKLERDQLQQRVLTLESELESATEAGFELNKLLNDFLTSQKENVNLNSSVDALQQQITKQAEIVALYETTAKQKENENYELRERCEKLSVEMDRLNNILRDTESNFEIIQFNNEDLKASKSELLLKFNELQEDHSNISRQLTEYTNKHDQLLIEIQQFGDKVNGLTIEIGNRDKEIESLKEIIDNFFSQGNGETNFEENAVIDSLNDLYNAVKIQSQLKNVELEKNDLTVKYSNLTLELQQLNNKIIDLDEVNKRLKDDKESAVHEKMKAQMELEVLSKYYKEKELELGKEIGVQHVQRMQKEDDASSLASQLAALEEENISYKTQFLSMKKEVAETDRRFKLQISQLEKQAHENWILARNAERKLEEAKAEASVLRQTLTMNVKSPVDGFGGDVSYMDDSASSVSSLHEHFIGAFPPPPPPPPPPPMSLYDSYNGFVSSMHMPFDENDASYGVWNSSMNSQPQMQTNFMPIQNDMLTSNNGGNYSSNQLPLSYVGSVPQQWDTSSNRDTYSPASHRSNDQNSRVNSPHPSFNAYPQSISSNQSHYPNSSMTIASPYSNSVNVNDYSFSGSVYNSYSSPVTNSASHTTSVLSNPVPSHWTKPNGNIPNNANSRESIEPDSRPTSRISNNSLHTSIV